MSRGIVRNLDVLGRIVLPIELRRVLEMDDGDSVEIFFNDETGTIVLKKYRGHACLFCSTSEDLFFYKKYLTCRACIRDILSIKNHNQMQQHVHPSDPVFTQQQVVGPIVRRKDTASRLVEAMKEHPSASKKDWAVLIGVSQSRVSQLLNKAKKNSTKPTTEVENVSGSGGPAEDGVFRT
ncbi:MAG: hypothetical protein K0Q73_4047 [Paenibacillus sp.]|nr:hypothetical protein [Paenibacillus sp.]